MKNTVSVNITELRKYVRLNTVFPVEFRIQVPGENEFDMTFYQAFTSNVSQGGMCLQVKDYSGKLTKAIRKGAKMMVFVNLPFKSRPAGAVAQIMWIKSTQKLNPDHVEYFLGLKYVSIDPVAQSEIITYARKLRRKPYIIAAQMTALMVAVIFLGINLVSYQKKAVNLMEGIKTLELEKKNTEDRLRSILEEKQKLDNAQLELQDKISGLESRLGIKADMQTSSENLAAQVAKLKKQLQEQDEQKAQIASLTEQIEKLKGELEGQQGQESTTLVLQDRIAQLQSQLKTVKAQRVSAKELSYAAERERQQLMSELEKARQEKEGVATLLDLVKSDKELLETKLEYYKNYQPVPEGILTKKKSELDAKREQSKKKRKKKRGPRIEVIEPKKLFKLETAKHIPQDKFDEFMVAADNIKSEDTFPDGCYLGAFLGPGKVVKQDINILERFMGKKLAQVVLFADWSTNFPKKQCETILKHNAIPHIAWEPWWWSNSGKVTLTDIILGKWDAYISKWAIACANFKHPIFIRWGHEFNGNWYPWTVALNKKNPDVYIKAYRRVHDIFKKYGANNVIWIWCMNNKSVPNEQWNRPELCYPGDDYVDWVGIDGYNFGKGQSWSTWKSFEAVFKGRYDMCSKNWNKPIMICEFASAEYGGYKGEWIEDFDAQLSTDFPQIKAVCWFNELKEKDWVMWSSPESIRAIQKAFAKQYYLTDGEKLAKVHKNS